jgi:hypothetical protein
LQEAFTNFFGIRRLLAFPFVIQMASLEPAWAAPIFILSQKGTIHCLARPGSITMRTRSTRLLGALVLVSDLRSTGEQKANLSGTLKIPAQVTWNAEIFSRQPCWEVQVNSFNFTN